MTARTPGVRFVIDGRGAVVQWSREAERFLGYSVAEAVGRHVTLLLDQPPTDAEAVGQVAARHRDGHRLAVRATVSPLSGPGGALHWSVRLISASDIAQDEIDAALLRALLTESPLGIQVVDGDLRIVRLNLSGPGVRGVVGAQDVGRHIRDVAPGLVDENIEQKIRHVTRTGRPVAFLHSGRPPADPAHDHVFSVTLLPMEDAAGRRIGAVVASQDVTERQRAQERLGLLVEAGSRIGTTLDIVTTAKELVAAMVPAMADIATIDVLDGVLRGEASAPGPVGEQTRLRRAAFLSAQEVDAQPAYDTGELVEYMLSSHIVGLTELRPVLVPHLRRDELPAGDRRTAHIFADSAHSLIVVPLAARGVVLGLATLYRARQSDPYDEDDLVLVAELCARAAVCIDNARQYTREHNAAQALQRTLLPRSVPQQNAVAVAWRHESANTPGDWFDVIPLSGARVALVVGCMVGQGIDAAAAMGQLRMAVNTLAARDLAPDELLGQLHDLVTGHSDEPAAESRGVPVRAHMQGATCLYAVYDPVSRHCTVARAGHPAPVFAGPQGAFEIPDIPQGPALGTGHPPYRTADLVLPENSFLALFTTSPTQRGQIDRSPAARTLCQVLGSNSYRTLEDACDAFVRAHQPVGDDGFLLLLARTRALDADRVAAWTLSPDPAVVTTARALSLRQLAHWGLNEMDFTTELIVSELVTNAIRYATGPIGLRLILDRALICEVSDDSSTAPHLRYAYETDEGGRGLFLIAQIARCWGTRYSARGKTIWAEQALPGPSTSRATAAESSAAAA
ncbi:SpoIIE family protein phosphatase [Streptomyces sp. NBC_01217]|uniref:SpoIIE family protein phosphatase n=1 Tax=Streptomyces sp. NBC_01217 TaxID=2903779 RepID=UPI002E14CBD8|nr:SpoIIE family protein phosphatase [Streptomyces sp. NBC_01217]